MALTSFRTKLLAIVLATAGGCTEGKHPFRMVQFCLGSSSEIPGFTRFMRDLASEYQMQFYDRSEETHQELRDLASQNENIPLNDRTINFGAQRGDDFSFGAGNLGMPTDQVVIGFNGTDVKASRSFANDTVERLSARWPVKEVPAGQGAFPLPNCD